MLTQRTAVLFDSLERRTLQGLGEIIDLRRQIAALQAENDRLRKQLQFAQDELSRQVARSSQSPASRPSSPQGDEHGYPLSRRLPPLAALKRPTPPTKPPETTPSTTVTNEASSSPATISDEADNSLPRQSRLAIGEAPSPQALLDEWYRRYTDTFFKGHTRPLKVGIHEDLAAHEPWPDKLVRRALACYVHLPRYLKAVRMGAERVDLQGRPARVGSESEARHAHKKLEALQAQQHKREKARGKSARDHKGGRLEHKLSELLAKHGRH